MIDNHKASVNAPGQIVGYVAHDAEAGRWRVDVNGGAWVSVRADNLQDAMSLAVVADQVMKLIPQARTQPGLAVVANDGLTELREAIGVEDDNVAVVIAGMVLDAETRIESLELLSGAIEQGNPPAKGSGPWPVWPAPAGGHDIKAYSIAEALLAASGAEKAIRARVMNKIRSAIETDLLADARLRAGEEHAAQLMSLVGPVLAKNYPPAISTAEFADRALRVCSIYLASGVSIELIKVAQRQVVIDTSSAKRWFGEDDAFATVDLARRIRDTLTIAPATAKAEAR